ncbi:hypothetical protein ES706_05452 [subsurface metagenome]
MPCKDTSPRKVSSRVHTSVNLSGVAVAVEQSYMGQTLAADEQLYIKLMALTAEVRPMLAAPLLVDLGIGQEVDHPYS